MYMENLCMLGSNKIDIEYVFKIRGNFNRIFVIWYIWYIENFSKIYFGFVILNCICILKLINILLMRFVFLVYV